MRHAILAIFLLATSLANAAGPVGFGEIKIGMTKAAVEALPESEAIRLTAELVPLVIPGAALGEGETLWSGQVSTPYGTALPVRLTFRGQQLTNINLSFNDLPSVFSQVLQQITTRYGPPLLEDARKDERCRRPHADGSKIMSGNIFRRWIQDAVQGGEPVQVRTLLVYVEGNRCPSGPLDKDTAVIKMRFLNIGEFHQAAKPRNAF